MRQHRLLFINRAKMLLIGILKGNMLKIITLNIETSKHYATVLPFLDKEDTDIVCLQEVPESFAVELNKRGYLIVYAPMLLKNINNTITNVGIMIASKYPLTHKVVYYHQNEASVTLHNSGDSVETLSLPYIFASIEIDGIPFSIATTHMIDTDDGREDQIQIQITEKFLSLINKENAHILCGDFNMPRGFNALYNEMLKYYTDTVPAHYKSSLDKNIHRLGSSTNLNAPMFESYMIDYVFTQPPYVASDVRLQFGVSDHAAVIATLTKSE